MTQAAPNILTALDWHQYRCQCTHHHQPCREPAHYILHIHALNRCNTVDTDPFGNRIEIRCQPCTNRLKAHINHELDRLNRWGLFCCNGCGAPIVELSDVLREQVKL